MLPWGSHPSSSSAGAGLPATVSVRINPFHPTGGSLSSLFSWGSTSRFVAGPDGTITAAPGTSYVIEVEVHELGGSSSEERGTLVVRASIDNVEINEQLVLSPPRSSRRCKFIGWLDDPTGAKRIKFTFPNHAFGESTIRVGVFRATPLEGGGGKGKDKAAMRPPPSAHGEVFAGPQVTDFRFAVGETVGVGSARLRSA